MSTEQAAASTSTSQAGVSSSAPAASSSSAPTTTTTATASSPTPASGSGSASTPTAAPTSSTPIRPTDSNASATSTPAPAGPLIAVAFYSLDPSTMKYHIKPAVCSSSASLANITSDATSTSSAAASHPSVTDAYNAAIDLVNFMDQQLSRPPNMAETFTALVRPANKEMGARIHKAEKKVRKGSVEVPGEMKGWEGTRKVQEVPWAEFVKVFGSD